MLCYALHSVLVSIILNALVFTVETSSCLLSQALKFCLDNPLQLQILRKRGFLTEKITFTIMNTLVFPILNRESSNFFGRQIFGHLLLDLG